MQPALQDEPRRSRGVLGSSLAENRPGNFQPDCLQVTKPYTCIGIGAMEVTEPYKFIGFGAMEVTKPYRGPGPGLAGGSRPAWRGAGSDQGGRVRLAARGLPRHGSGLQQVPRPPLFFYATR